jgi:hypothetical protein
LEMCGKGGMTPKMRDFHPGRSPARNGGAPIQIRTPKLVKKKYCENFFLVSIEW